MRLYQKGNNYVKFVNVMMKWLLKVFFQFNFLEETERMRVNEEGAAKIFSFSNF